MTASSPEQRIAAVKQALTSAQAQRARLEAQRDHAAQQESAALAQLAQYGVTDLAAAHTLLAQFDTEIGQLIDAAEAALGRTIQ